jgi:sec-independent protein translocase protein TatA
VNLGAPELLIILVVILLLFGATKLPKLARSLGEAQKEFKAGIGSESGGSAPVAEATPPAPDPTPAPEAPPAASPPNAGGAIVEGPSGEDGETRRDESRPGPVDPT